MGKKTLKLPSLFKTKEKALPRKHPWQLLASCGQRKTLSFRAGGDTFKQKGNSVNVFDPTESTACETADSTFTATSESAVSLSTESEDYHRHNINDGESLEMLVRGVVRSERLFFEPGNTSSILEKAMVGGFPFKESVVLAMDSQDPHEDFRSSMEEMVETHGMKDWEGLEELLSWYLRANGKTNHGFIVMAFVDLLISLASASDDSCSLHSISYASAASSFASSPL